MRQNSTAQYDISNSSLSLAKLRKDKSHKSDVRILREILEVMCLLCEKNIKFISNWVIRLWSRGKHAQNAIELWLPQWIFFHALQQSLNFLIKTKHRLVSNAPSRPLKSFAAPNTKLGTSTHNCISTSSCNTCGTSSTNLHVLALPPKSHKDTQSV